MCVDGACAFSTCVPRAKDHAFIKPRSAEAYPLAIIRIFGRWGVTLSTRKALKATLHHLSRLYMERHGPHSLAPRRAEPMKYAMVHVMLEIDSISMGAQVGKFAWNDDNPDVFNFRRLNLVMWPTAMRLAEMLKNGVVFSNLTWSLAGMVITDPTNQQLLAMIAGRDFVRLTPPPAKLDQFGEIHCPFPIILPFYDEPGNAARALIEVELRATCHGASRDRVPLFHQPNGAPYTHAQLDAMLSEVLAYLYGPSVATVFTWQSYRAGRATALYAAGVDDARIQLICRWMCVESLHLYRRMSTSEYSRLTRRAMHASVDVLQGPNLSAVREDVAYAKLASNAARPSADSLAHSNARVVHAARLRAVSGVDVRAVPCVAAAAVMHLTNISPKVSRQ
ncbi:MAG: hypothetical protein SGPRY_004684 [Prymnesium sp.]